jgi:hypothetical protein
MDSNETIDFLRSKLAPAPDAYALALADQNNGSHCIHCQSRSGHLGVCPLINREIAETLAALWGGRATEGDKIQARALGVRLD